MPAYWVARSKINDPAEYKKYTDLVPGIIAKFGGRVLARGGRYQIMEGPDKFHRFVVIEFPTFEQGVACFTSPEYNRAAAFRRNGAVAAFALIAGALAAAPAAAQTGEPVKIGYSMALTGGLAPNGKSALLAQKIWEEDTNAKGGLSGS